MGYGATPQPLTAPGSFGGCRPRGPAPRELDHLCVTLALFRGSGSGSCRRAGASAPAWLCLALRLWREILLSRRCLSLSGACRFANPKCLLAGSPSLRRLCGSRSLPSCFAGITLPRPGALHFISGANTNFRRTEPSPGQTVPPGLTEMKGPSSVFKPEAFQFSELTNTAHLSVE